MTREEKRPATQSAEGETIVPVSRHLELVPSRLMERLDRLFGEWDPWWPRLRLPEATLRAPAVDVYEEKDASVVETELPGMKKEDVEVQLTGDVLTITGKAQSEKKEEKKNYFRLERSASAVSRTIRLPVEVQADKLTATLKDGVLEIQAPKSEAAKASSRNVPVT